MRALLAAGLVLLSGCSKETLSVNVEIHELTPTELTLQVKTAPGVRVARSYGELGKGLVTGADGIARVPVPRSAWKHLQTTSLEVHANGDGIGRKRYGQGAVRVPFNVQKLVQIPEGGPLHFAFLAGVELHWREKETVTFVDPTEARSAPKKAKSAFDRATFWMPKEKAFSFWFAAPPGATVTIGGTELSAGNGLAKADIPSDHLALFADMATLREKLVVLSIPVDVSKDAQTKSHTMTLHAESPRGESWWLAARLDAVEQGRTFPAGTTVAALLHRRASDEILHFGAKGRAREARWISIEHGTKRNEDSSKRPCPLHGYEDVAVTVLEAQSGKKLASKRFTAPDVRCEGVFVSGARKLVYGPREESITTWLEAGMAKEWK